MISKGWRTTVFSLGFLLSLGAPALAEEPASHLCWNWANPKAAENQEKLPNSSLLTTPKEGEDVVQVEKQSSGESFVRISGLVSRPGSEILALLKRVDTVKDPKKSDIETKLQKLAGWDWVMDVTITVHPFLFVSVTWTERWGVINDPQGFRFFYEKIDGTSHITKLCGVISVRTLAPNQAQVILNEHLNASHQDENDSLNDLKGTLKTLREKKL